jgi:hypothetical protein
MEERRSVLTLGYYHVVPMGLLSAERSGVMERWSGLGDGVMEYRSDGVVLVPEKLLKQLNVEWKGCHRAKAAVLMRNGVSPRYCESVRGEKPRC